MCLGFRSKELTYEWMGYYMNLFAEDSEKPANT